MNEELYHALRKRECTSDMPANEVLTCCCALADKLSSRTKATNSRLPPTAPRDTYDAWMGVRKPPMGGPMRIPREKDARMRPKLAALWPGGSLSETYARQIDRDEMEPFSACTQHSRLRQWWGLNRY